MEENSTDSRKRLVRNTALLYVRMLVTMLIGLYTSRANLWALGVDDYGINNVVGGFVVMFSMVANVMVSSYGRFITFALGKGDKERMEKVFCQAQTIQLILSVLVFFLIETVGYWFLMHKMVIPAPRYGAAIWVFHISALSFCLSMTQAPYNALLNAHEHMDVFAYLSMFEAFGKLAVVLMIPHVSFDRLIFLAAGIFVISLLSRAYAQWYCLRHFEECKLRLTFDKPLFKEMFGYSFWNFIGSLVGNFSEHGGNVVLNLFFGPAINAARAVAIQVKMAVGSFSSSFIMAIVPQITKSYASGDNQYLQALVYKGARFSYYLMLLISMPVILNTQYLIRLWLGQVPDETVLFLRLMLVNSLLGGLTNTIGTARGATGNIRNYSLANNFIKVLALPVAYILFCHGAFPQTITIIDTIVILASIYISLYLVKDLFPIWDFTHKVLMNVGLVSVVAFSLPWLINSMMMETFERFLLITFISVLWSTFTIFYVGCDKQERVYLWNTGLNYVKKLRKKM